MAHGLLECMCDVSSDGAPGVTHQHKVARVHDEVRVAEHGAPLAYHDVGVACTAAIKMLRV